MSIIKCNECKKEISDKAESCPHCGAPVVKCCPECGSTNFERISDASKKFNALIWGVFAVNTVLNNFKCRNCGAKFK